MTTASMSERRRPRLTARQVLARMTRGDFPTNGGGYFTIGYFADGARSGEGVMRRLIKQGRVNAPVGTHCDATWTLALNRAKIIVPEK